jgi:hypothetical protein
MEQANLSQKDFPMAADQVPIVMEEVTDPVQIAEARARRERFDRNWAWFEEHAAEVYASHRGKCICVAGEELFVADTPGEVLALATAAHPEDDGRFTLYIPRERMTRIYAHQRCLAPLLGRRRPTRDSGRDSDG